MVFARQLLKAVAHPWVLLCVAMVLAVVYVPKGWIPLSGGELRASQIDTLLAGRGAGDVARLLGELEGSGLGCGFDTDQRTVEAVLSHVGLGEGDIRVGGGYYEDWATGNATGTSAAMPGFCETLWYQLGDTGTKLSGMFSRR